MNFSCLNLKNKKKMQDCFSKLLDPCVSNPTEQSRLKGHPKKKVCRRFLSAQNCKSIKTAIDFSVTKS